MKRILVNTQSGSYDIITGNGILTDAGSEISKIYSGKKIAVITDETVCNLHGDKLAKGLSGFDVSFIVIKPGESSKSLQMLAHVYSKLAEIGITRSDMIAAFGGGVVGDLAGFAASTYLRGIRYVQIPTTLLSQIDSSIGGKTAVNLPEGKNLAGTFWQPSAVISDADTLLTLPEKVLLDGMGEVIKYACIEDEEFFKRLESINFHSGLTISMEDIIHTCCLIKSKIVSDDERDTGLRMKLNFGHTVAHGIEKCFNYETYSHGHAVAIGMLYIAQLGERIGVTASGTSDRLKSLAENLSIDASMPVIDMGSIRNAILKDKKNLSGNINLIMLEKLGSSFIMPVSINKLPEYFI